MNDKVIRYCPWPLHTQVWAHIPIFIVTCVYHTSTQHITYVHTHAHAQSRCAEELCTVLEHRVKAVSLCSCSNSHFQSGLGRKGCCPASSPVSTSTLQEGLAVSASAPRPPHQSPAKPGSDYKTTLRLCSHHSSIVESQGENKLRHSTSLV